MGAAGNKKKKHVDKSKHIPSYEKQEMTTVKSPKQHS